VETIVSDLLCVEWDVKLYSLTHLPIQEGRKAELTHATGYIPRCCAAVAVTSDRTAYNLRYSYRPLSGIAVISMNIFKQLVEANVLRF